jgi:hypothetical protein
MINAVIIPPAMDQPLRCVELNLQDFAKYQAGTMQAYELSNPAMRLYLNGICKPCLNIRAMFILWAHNRELAYRTTVTGPALLTGVDNGANVDVPDEIMGLIFKATRYRVAADGRDGLRYEELPFSYADTVYDSVPSIESEVSLSAVIVAKVRAWCSG